jgi:acyl carrier protein
MNPQLLILMAAFIEDEVRLDSRLKEDLGMSTADITQLVTEINKTFAIQIHSREIIPAYFDSVESVQDFIARKQAER